MIRVVGVDVCGISAAGAFSGRLEFTPGLQVISAENSYGKSLAARCIAWCLGIETLFGTDDASFFPLAVREDAKFGEQETSIISSEATLTLANEDGRYLRLTRAIRGDTSTVAVEEVEADGFCRESRLMARKDAMKDATGGLQRFLFDWMGVPRVGVGTFRGTTTDLYLENLAALFYIEQDEGWTDIQARQITRYQQLQIAQVAVEYLLGAVDAVRSRVAEQNAIRRDAELRASAKIVSERVTSFFARQGWPVAWISGGSVADIAKRWTTTSLVSAARDRASVDFAAERLSLQQHAAALRQLLVSDPIDPANASAHAEASQRVIELKQRRHALSEELRLVRVQEAETAGLLDSLEHRIHGSVDVLRLKVTGVGRLEVVECPTCHRDLDPDTFQLTQQSEDAVRAHIEALKRDRDLVKRNLDALSQRLKGVQAELGRTEADFRDAERALVTVTAAVGTVREQLAAAATNLSVTERRLDRLEDTEREMRDLQSEIDEWVRQATSVTAVLTETADLQRRLQAFTLALRQYLVALGHSAVTASDTSSVHLDDQYKPLRGARHLLSLGSASDRPRVIAAYSLALAAASVGVAGFHPGFVILDEPLQQNPDEPHRDLFLNFLSEELARNAQFQIIVLTSLRSEEIEFLRRTGVPVDVPPGDHLLSLQSPTELGPPDEEQSLDGVPPEADSSARGDEEE